MGDITNRKHWHGDLIRFTIKDFEDWCNEYSLKTIERIRFVDAVKNLPNAKANEPQAPTPQEQQTRTFIYLSKEEQSQREKFEDMKANIEILMTSINNIDKTRSSNEKSLINNVNNACDEIQTLVEQLRTNLLSQLQVLCIMTSQYMYNRCFVTICTPKLKLKSITDITD